MQLERLTEISAKLTERLFPHGGHDMVEELVEAVRSKLPKGVGCYDCGRQYGDEHGFPDLIIPNTCWRQISPSGGDGGLLCPSCICARLAISGISNVEGAFMSGPIKSVDSSLMSVLCWIENYRDENLAAADAAGGVECDSNTKGERDGNGL